MEEFVRRHSIVRTIWGKSDTILFIFAGASAEFALNKAVDWLYFTGKLPADPLGRLFSTVSYARGIVFSSMEEAHRTIDKISSIHASVETARGARMPDWAYRDVLFMLIHYSIASFELLERKLTADEKEEVYNVFYRVGARMGIPALPQSYIGWLPVREQHLQQDLEKGHYTVNLYTQYHRHLGPFRYLLLKEAQILVVPERVRRLLGLRPVSLLGPVIPMYKLSRLVKLDQLLKAAILPREYQPQIRALDQPGV
jgi:hypothetical protein